MRDQATELRNLMLRAARTTRIDHGPPPRLLIISGGRGGVGVTTVSVRLALALAGQGIRVVLVDADPYRADVAAMCDIQQRGSITDVLNSRCDIHEVLQAGPRGVQVVPGAWASNKPPDFGDVAQQRLLRQLRTLGRHADLVLVDAGTNGSEAVRRFWQAADEIVFVTTPEPISVMDCYAAVKRMSSDGAHHAVRLLVNRVADPRVGDDVHRRIDRSCRRFLQTSVGLLGHVPQCPDVGRQADTGGAPLPRIAERVFEQLAVLLIAESSRDGGQRFRADPRREDANKDENWAQLDPGPIPIGEGKASLCLSKSICND
jgi:flagellar biosynthesis protein FlhG